MAVVIPVVMLFFSVMFELCRVLMLQHTVDTAAYEAARSAMVPGATAAEAEQIAQQLLDASGLTASAILVTPSTLAEDTSLISVNVQVPIAQNSWIVPRFFTAAAVSSEVTLICERPPVVRLSAMGDLSAKKSKMKSDSTAG